MTLQFWIYLIVFLFTSFAIGWQFAVLSVQASDAPEPAKQQWILVLTFIPVFGLIAWLLKGPKSRDMFGQSNPNDEV